MEATDKQIGGTDKQMGGTAVYCEVNGVRYHLQESGTGEALLLLHGFTGSSESWRRFLPAWSQRYRTIAVDLLGHGKTEAPTDPARYRMEQAAADLTALLDALEIDSAHVLGYSMGGRLALSLAMSAPQRVRSLILESSSPGLRTQEERAARIRQDEALAQRIEREGLAPFVAYWENLPLFASVRRLPEDVQLALRRQRLANSPAGLAASLRGMGTGAQPSWWEYLHQLPMPVLLIAGEEDEKFVYIARKMHALIPHSRFELAEHAGHIVHVEVPDIFDTMVIKFLTSLQ